MKGVTLPGQGCYPRPTDLLPIKGVMSQFQPNQTITFVCCVESGYLEVQTVRMIESLRRWGGSFTDALVFAVTPRLGPPLSKKTLQAFDRLQTTHLSFQANTAYAWNHFLNKPNALVAVEERSQSEAIAWLDSDLLIVDEPNKLYLQPEENFLACASDRNIGTTGPDNPFESYWREICGALAINLEDLPWITTEQEHERIRLYWNSGVFVYRRSTGFAKHFLQTCLQLLDSRIANHNSGIYFIDQVALGLCMVKMGLTWRALPYSHNYTMNSLTHKDWYSEDALKAAKIIHYHDAMWPPFWSTLIKCLADTHPEVANWLSSLGPMRNEAPIQWRLIRKLLEHQRSYKEKAHRMSCRVV